MRNIALLIISLFITINHVSAQSVMIVGKVQNADEENINRLLKQFEKADRGYRKISIMYGSDAEPMSYKRNQADKVVDAHKWVSNLVYSSSKIEKGDIADEVILANMLKKRAQLLVYDPLGTESDDSYSDFNKLEKALIALILKKKRVTVLYIARKLRPDIVINSPLDLRKVKSKRFSGEVRYNEQIKSVIFKVNDGEWQRASGEYSWSILLDLNADRYNKVTAAVVDRNNDTSDFIEREVFYSKSSIRNPAIQYLFPNENAEVVPKCKNGSIFNFKISFQADEALEDDKLYLNIRDLDLDRLILHERVSSYYKPLSTFMTVEGTQYCIYLYYKYLGKQDVCSFSIEDNYEMFFTYEDREIKMPAPIVVKFSSFESSYTYNGCLCN